MRAASLLLLASGLAGCQPKEEAPPALTVTPVELAFGTVALGESSVLTFELANTGGGSVELLSVSLVEGDASVFDVSRDGTATLGAGEATTVTVTFAPEDERAYDGSIQVRSDDEANANVFVALSGEGSPSTTDADGDGYSPATGDCDDGNAGAFPGAPELCDGRDNNCDGSVPADEADADYDGWLVCEGDCNDGATTIYPGAPEICDDADSDCDGTSADRDDLDGDGYAVCDDDCDDAEPRVNPGEPEACDTLDNDCSGTPDDIDVDGDGHSPCGAAGDCDDEDATAYPVVVADGATGEMDGTEEHPYATLEDGLANLDRVCRTVQLEPGEYEVAIAWSGGAVRIGGAGLDASEVVLTAPEAARHFDVSGGASLTLANLTLTGGDVSGDGGSVRAVDASLALEGVVLDGNHATGDGGAVAVSSGALDLTDCTFSANVADDDGGAVSVLSGAITDGGSTYTGNTAVRGGALVVEASDVALADGLLVGNTASDQGGAIELLGGTVAMERLSIWRNSAGTSGGGLSVVDVSDPLGFLRNLHVADNDAGGDGGGIALTGSTASLLVVNNSVLGNRGESGAGMYVGATDADGLYLWSNIVAWSNGRSGLDALPDGASVAYTLAYATTSGVDIVLSTGNDDGGNLGDDPGFRDYSNDGDPTNDDVRLTSASPARDSGPPDGEGPPGYTSWSDPDGTQNDRGSTGGPGASP